jgi:hypothetical protein
MPIGGGIGGIPPMNGIGADAGTGGAGIPLAAGTGGLGPWLESSSLSSPPSLAAAATTYKKFLSVSRQNKTMLINIPSTSVNNKYQRLTVLILIM